MASIAAPTLTQRLPWRALAGPAAAGACLGLASDLSTSLYWVVTLPLLLVVLSALMLPALYIAATLLGESSDATALGRSALATLDDAGTVLLGVSPALGFLVVTTEGALTLELGAAALAATALVAVRSLFLRLFVAQRSLAEVPPSVLLAYSVWSLVAAGIGADWFVTRALQTLGGAS